MAKSLHLQIAEHLRERLRNGSTPCGETLPPERELAVAYKVSRPTIRNAIQHLINEGLLRSEQGRGTFVLALPPPRVTPPPVLHLVLSSPTGTASKADAFVRSLTLCFAALPNRLAAGVRMLVTGPEPEAVAASIQGMDPAHLHGGVVFVGITAPADGLLGYLEMHGIPAVLIGESTQAVDGLVSLRADHARSGAAAAAHLAAHGRQRILLLDGPWSHHPCRLRQEGFLAAGPLPGVELSIAETVSWDADHTQMVVGTLLDRHPRPDAIVTGGDACLRGVIAALATRGLRMPQDIAVVGLGVPDPSALPGAFPITCWQPDLAILAQRAAEVLLAGRRGSPTADPTTILVPDHPRIGRSCGCVEP